MAPSRAAHGEAEDDDDPVENEFDVFITPPMNETDKLYLFQYPTRERDRPYSLEAGKLPTEMRMKPKSGFIEIDVPLDTDAQYNKDKAQKWGEAMHAHRNDGGFGLASGLINAQGPRVAGRGRGRAAREDDDAMAVDAPAMGTQTLGGQIYTPEKGSPQYMLGVFSGDQLHLTPLAGIVQMRPQFHNMDAQALSEKASKQRAAQAAAPASGRGGGAGGPEPRAVTMTTKPTTDNEDMSISDSKAILELAQQEPWSKLEYVDDEDPRTWAVWEKKLFIPTETIDYVCDLVSSFSDEQYLDKISARRHEPKPDKKKKKKQDGKGKEREQPVDISSDEDGGDAEGERSADANIERRRETMEIESPHG